MYISWVIKSGLCALQQTDTVEKLTLKRYPQGKEKREKEESNIKSFDEEALFVSLSVCLDSRMPA